RETWLFITNGVSQENGSIKIYTPQKCGMHIIKFFVIYTVYLTGMGSYTGGIFILLLCTNFSDTLFLFISLTDPAVFDIII
ncbi:MAG: hypothetical protein IJC78_07830, partial [Clostridia bacterium]|nr:hypothetical protein [Clostridia bacterium]